MGVSIAINDDTKIKQVFNRLEKAVNAKAVELGINTKLETPSL